MQKEFKVIINLKDLTILLINYITMAQVTWKRTVKIYTFESDNWEEYEITYHIDNTFENFDIEVRDLKYPDKVKIIDENDDEIDEFDKVVKEFEQHFYILK